MRPVPREIEPRIEVIVMRKMRAADECVVPHDVHRDYGLRERPVLTLLRPLEPGFVGAMRRRAPVDAAS